MQKFFVFLVFTLCLLIPIRPVCGADSTTFNPTTVAVIAKGTSSIPVGTIISWPVAQNPADWQNSDGSYNWLECNGQSISKTVYPELFALVGGQVPDLRGLFLRGHGGNSAGLGAHQGHATRNYNGVGYIWTGFGADLQASGAFVWNSSWGISAPAASWGGWNCNQYRIDVSPAAYGVPVADEVRPDNQAVRYLIRAIP